MPVRFFFTSIFSKGGIPQLIEDDVFKIIIPIAEQVTEQAVLVFCETPRSTKEIMNYLGLKQREYFRSEILKPLLKIQQLFMTLPDKPNSPKQKYYSKS